MDKVALQSQSQTQLAKEWAVELASLSTCEIFKKEKDLR